MVLAAGGGSRFAGDGHKLVVPLRGAPLVTWSVRAAVAADLDQTIVVWGAVPLDGLMPAGVVLVENQQWSTGLASSLRAALAETTDHDAVVVGLGDQPFVPAEAWRAVAASDAPIAVATYAGRRRNPVRLAREVWPLLPAGGDRGARDLIAERPDLVVEVACSGEPADVDTAEDLARWS